MSLKSIAAITLVVIGGIASAIGGKMWTPDTTEELLKPLNRKNKTADTPAEKQE